MSRRRRLVVPWLIAVLAIGLLPPAATLAADPVADNKNATTPEDTAVTIQLTGTDTDNQNLTFTLGTMPAAGSVALAVTQPNCAGPTTCRLDAEYTPAANYNGPDSFTYTVFDGTTASPPATVTITVTSRNDAPSFTKGGNESVLEDSGAQVVSGWATAIAPGPVSATDESGQTVTFTATNNNNALFSTQPAVSSSGELTYTPAANAFGAATVTVSAVDNGGTANGGVNTSAGQTFTISVTGVNDPPSFTTGANQTVAESAGAQSVPGWATNISQGPNETGQTVTFDVSSDNTAIFTVQPAVSSSGTLTFTPASVATDQSATVTIFAQDNGGTANGGDNTGGSQTFTITVQDANSTPVANSQNSAVNEDGQVAITLTGSDAEDEPLGFAISNPPDNGTLGTIGTPNCTLTNTCSASVTYTPNADYVGADSLTFTVNDGVLTSSAGTVSITVNAVNDPPSFTKGADQTVDEDAGPQTVVGWATSISKGPANESAQTLTFNVTGNTNAALFSAGPAVSSTGTLTYTPASNASGMATVTLVLQDNGGVVNGGDDSSDPQSFTITVTPVDEAPVANPQVVALNEDTPTVITLTGSDGDDDNLTFAIVDSPTIGTLGSFGAVSCAALFSCSRAVTYTPTAQLSGADSFAFTVTGGGATSTAATVSVTVNPVNDAPSFTKGLNQTVLEDAGPQSVPAWASAILPGPATATDETGQTVSFSVTGNTSPALFSAGPAVAANGTLTYTPAADAFGVATVTVAAVDSGGVANGGVDTSAGQTFTITITGVNDPPTFTKGADQTSLEDAGARTVNPWATAISQGPGGETGQVVTLAVTGNTNPTLFSVAPAVSATGVLTYTAAPNANGTATITISPSDSGGTANGGDPTGTPQSFTITVTAVNDVPSFTKGANQTAEETPTATARTVPSWATALAPGPATATDEAAQTLSFVVSNNNTTLFSVQPAVSPTGTLTYTQGANRSGTATVTVAIKDSGGTANGGVDTSASQQFTIEIQGINNDPVAANDTATIPEGAAATSVAVLANDSDLDAGNLLLIDRVTCGSTNSATSCSTSGGTVTVTGGGTGLTFAPTWLWYGQTSFGYRINDGQGGSDTATVLVTVTRDTTGPIARAPTSGRQDHLTSTTTAVKISWRSATDAGSGISKYQLQEKVGSGSFVTITLSSNLSKSITRTLRYGTLYQYRVRAIDGEGNTGGWATAPAFKPLRILRAST